MNTDQPFNIRAARDRLGRRVQAEQARNRVLYDRASEEASSIIARIIELARPDRVYQWGSLLTPGLFREYSDIDIAVEGVRDAGVFFKILAEAEQLATFPVDIVQLETIEPEFANQIRAEGKLVYEHT